MNKLNAAGNVNQNELNIPQEFTIALMLIVIFLILTIIVLASNLYSQSKKIKKLQKEINKNNKE